MQTVFITGDRSIDPDIAMGLVALTMLKSIGVDGGNVLSGESGVNFATGTEPGVEAAVRFACEFAGVNVQVFETPAVEGHEAEGWKDFGQRAKNVLTATDNPELPTKFLVLHGDPQSSRITKQTLDAVPEDQVELVHPALV